MRKEDLRREWLDLSPAWINQARETNDPIRRVLLDRPILRACGSLEGLKVLDCGCGEGRFCRVLVERGAQYVLGIDTCEPMIEAARELQCEREEYLVVDAEDLGRIEDAEFDLAVSYMNQCDLPDFGANNREVFRVLKPGGRFIVANLHPMRSAVGRWSRTVDGQKLHVILDNYFDEGPRRWAMMGGVCTNFHRALSRYVGSFLEAGFGIEGLVEPTVTAEDVTLYPELDDERRVPNFIVYILRKL